MNCPICDSYINTVDTIETEYFNTRYYETVEGTCQNCGKSWRWVEVFTFSHCTDIEQIENDGHL